MKILEEGNFPYETELGHYYLIKRPSKEELEVLLKEHEKAKERYYSDPKNQ